MNVIPALERWFRQRPAYQAKLLDEAWQACSDHDLPTLQRCLDAGMDINGTCPMGSSYKPKPAESILYLAVKHGFSGGVLLLLERGADPNRVESMGELPLLALMTAISDDDVSSIAKALITAGADLDLKSWGTDYRHYAEHDELKKGWVSVRENIEWAPVYKKEMWESVLAWADPFKRSEQLDEALPAPSPPSSTRKPRF